MISKETIEEIKNKIIKLENPDKIILFGSYAHGDANENSDLDILIIKETSLKPPKRAANLHWLLASYPFNIDLLVKTKKEFEKWQDVTISFNSSINKEGKILYEQSIHKKMVD